MRPRKVSFEIVRDQGKNDLDGQPLKVVQSTPSLKKGSPTRKFGLGKEAVFGQRENEGYQGNDIGVGH